MKIRVMSDKITIDADHINSKNRLHTNADIVMYKGRVYLSTSTDRYWRDSWRGKVIELRNIEGRKILSVGDKEIDCTWVPGEIDLCIDVSQKVKDFYYKLQIKSKEFQSLF